MTRRFARRVALRIRLEVLRFLSHGNDRDDYPGMGATGPEWGVPVAVGDEQSGQDDEVRYNTGQTTAGSPSASSGCSTVKRTPSLYLLCVFGVLAGFPARAEIVQSAGGSGGLWAMRDGAQLRISAAAGQELEVELPPGASIRELEPTADGWLAAGLLPTSGGSDLLLIEGGEQPTDLLPVPERGTGRYRGQPVLFLESQRLVGLAWAEGNGPREMEIRASLWQDGTWGPPELVSPQGPGSQVAPVGVVLEDGSWLLLWAAFDGQDDEIVASRRFGGRWSPPEPIHDANDVPDLMPDLVPIDGGALAVWSWFDGNDYRLKTARWLGEVWRDVQVSGGKGSGESRLMLGEDRILLLFSSVEPSVWTILEMDRGGNGRRIAVVPRETYERPLLLAGGEDGAILRWSEGDRVLEWRDLP